jgi:hypothetical protein
MRAVVALALRQIGRIALSQGDLETTRQRCEEALAFDREPENPYGDVKKAPGDADGGWRRRRSHPPAPDG